MNSGYDSYRANYRGLSTEGYVVQIDGPFYIAATVPVDRSGKMTDAGARMLLANVLRTIEERTEPATWEAIKAELSVMGLFHD